VMLGLAFFCLGNLLGQAYLLGRVCQCSVSTLKNQLLYETAAESLHSWSLTPV
jgi:hypothetical protein